MGYIKGDKLGIKYYHGFTYDQILTKDFKILVVEF